MKRGKFQDMQTLKIKILDYEITQERSINLKMVIASIQMKLRVWKKVKILGFLKQDKRFQE